MFLYKSTQNFCFFTKIWFSTYAIFYNDSNKYSLDSIHTTTPSTQCFDYYQRDKDIYCRFPSLHPDLLLSFTPVKTFTQIPNPTLYLRNSGNRFPNHCIWLGLFLSQRIHLCLCIMVLTFFFLCNDLTDLSQSWSMRFSMYLWPIKVLSNWPSYPQFRFCDS